MKLNMRNNSAKAPTKLMKNNRFDVLNEPSKSQRNNQRHNSNNSKSKNKNTKTTKTTKKNVIPFSNNMQAFPSLSGTSNKKNDTNTTTSDLDNSYANVAKPFVPVSKKQNQVKPGWVNINFVDNKINYTRNTENKKPDVEVKTSNGLDEEQHCKLKNMVLRWETYRNNENEMYGESSVFWHEKSLLDPLSDDCYSDTDDSDESSIEAMDDEYDELYDDI
tara:strand:+ start:1338 stop:1994 length:657 start_codon:yes stop_codon:yes gene_type:complete